MLPIPCDVDSQLHRMQAARSGRFAMRGSGPRLGGVWIRQAVGTTRHELGAASGTFSKQLQGSVGLSCMTGSFVGCLAALCQHLLGSHNGRAEPPVCSILRGKVT